MHETKREIMHNGGWFQLFESAAPRGSHSAKSSITDTPPLSISLLPKTSNATVSDISRRSKKFVLWETSSRQLLVQSQKASTYLFGLANIVIQ